MSPRLLVDAVICAKDEAPRIAPVVRAVLAAGCIRKLLVVDDGSGDGTGDVARAAGATVLSLRPNRGKGAAMLAGARACGDAGAIAFVDADLVGLRADHVCAMVDDVASGRAVMACGMRDYGNDFDNRMQMGGPLVITGERCVRRDALLRLPERYWRGYRIEVGINEAVRRVGGRVTHHLFDGVRAVMKWEKACFNASDPACADRGADAMWSMAEEILEALTELREDRF